MNTVSETKKVYQNHRDNQLERILDAAEALFIRDGIDNVSMGAIADEARITRNTIYQYFPNKIEIALSIFQKFVSDLYAGADLSSIPAGTGFQRLEYMVFEMVNMLEKYPDHMRFLVEFNTIYAREGDASLVHQSYQSGNEHIVKIIEQGIADGSIRPEFDPGYLTDTIFNLISGMNGRFALLGNQVSQEYGRPALNLYREICRIFLQGIRSPSS